MNQQLFLRQGWLDASTSPARLQLAHFSGTWEEGSELPSGSGNESSPLAALGRQMVLPRERIWGL